MEDKILYIVDKSDMPLQVLQSVLSPFLYTGTMIDSLYSLINTSVLNCNSKHVHCSLR